MPAPLQSLVRPGAEVHPVWSHNHVVDGPKRVKTDLPAIGGAMSDTLDTPRTDDILKIASIEDRYVQLVDLARELERELSEAKDAYIGLKGCTDALLRDADERVMRWFKAASPYATPGSLEGGLDRLRACENALMDLYEANAKGVFQVPDEHYSLITNAAEVLKPDPLAVIAALRRKGWNSAIRRSAEVAEHYAGLMKSEAAQRVADEIRAMLSDGKS
jgi:hypothetical protein